MDHAYRIDNEKGESLVSQECRGMGTHYSWCGEMADLFTCAEAHRLQLAHGGTVVRA